MPSRSYLGGWPSATMVEHESQSNIEARVERALNEYLTSISELGLLKTVLVALDEEEGVARFYNVFDGDPDIAATADPRYAELTSRGARLSRELRSDLTVRLSYVNRSQLRELKKQQKACGSQLLEIPLPSSA